MACCTSLTMCASSSVGKCMSRSTSSTTTWTTTETNRTIRAIGSPNFATTRSKASTGASRSSSERVSQTPLKVAMIISALIPRSVIAVSIRPAASAMTPDSASWA